MAAFLPLPHQLSHDQMDFGNCEFESSHWMCPITPVRCGCLGSHSVTSNLANARGMGKSWQYLDQWITFVFNGAHSHTRVRNPLTGYPPIFSQASTVVSGKLRRIPFATHHVLQVACYVHIPSRELIYPPKKTLLEMIFLSPKSDMLVPRRVSL